MSSSDPRPILFVLGMHRSGTSALCAAFAACGATFGSALIDPMAGVNDEGFWEDADVVAVNEQLLALANSAWYALQEGLGSTDWSSSNYRSQREQAAAILARGFGEGQLQVVKDPRLCLTLPMWLSLCAEGGIPYSVCVASRAPLEVAHSLRKRDGFPLGYGLRLYASYRRCMARFAPADTLGIRYDDLLRDPLQVMAGLAKELPLEINESKLASAVRADLRHQATDAGDQADSLAVADSGDIDLDALDREIESRYPVDQALREFARALVERGVELTQVGEQHSAALATLDERDADIEGLADEHRRALATLDERDADIAALSSEHRQALATVDERDEQIREFDRRLATLGDEHSHALEVVRERDAQVALLQQRLDYIYNLPGVGLVIRRLRKNAQG